MMMEARARRVFHQGKLHGEPRIFNQLLRSFLSLVLPIKLTAVSC
jgi:hypothetical protein